MLSESAYYTLYELNSLIRAGIEASFPDLYWVVAEISEIRINAKGHCYISLIEKDDREVVAEMRATLWAASYQRLAGKFAAATGEEFRKGMQVLMLTEVAFHERYGLSLNIRDIDPSYTLGEMARKKRETIERLRKEGLIGLNAQLALPPVPQNVAVVSSLTAAGYGDFTTHLEHSPRGFHVSHTLYQSLMQGAGAEGSLIAALKDIRKKYHAYDCVVIIRGGGSQADLSCFDSYQLAAAIAKFPRPVITGIGHERDDTVADIVAHTRRKTPTDAAEFILSRMAEFEDGLLSLQARLIHTAEAALVDQRHKLRYLTQELSHRAHGRFSAEKRLIADAAYRLGKGADAALHGNRRRLSLAAAGLVSAEKSFCDRHESRLSRLSEAVRHLDPSHILRRGYSITYFEGKSLKRAGNLKAGDVVMTKLHEGSIESRVEDING